MTHQTSKPASARIRASARHHAAPRGPLRLSHAKHTGRRLHNRHTSYPILAIILVVTAFILFRSTLTTYAATTVSARITNPYPIGPTSPLYDGAIAMDGLWIGFGMLIGATMVLWLGNLSEIAYMQHHLLIAAKRRRSHRHA